MNDFNRFGRLYRVYLQAEPEYRSSEKARFFYTRNDEGGMVPLSTLVSSSRTRAPSTPTASTSSARPRSRASRPRLQFEQALAALEEVATEVLPSDMSYAWNAMSFQEKAAEGSGSVVFLMALVFVF